MGRWGGRDCDYTGARDEEPKSRGFQAKGEKPTTLLNEKEKFKAPESKKVSWGFGAKDSGRWGGRASDTAGARDAGIKGMATDPLQTGSSREAVGHNVKTEESAGKPHKQAIAIALNKAGLSNKK